MRRLRPLVSAVLAVTTPVTAGAVAPVAGQPASAVGRLVDDEGRVRAGADLDPAPPPPPDVAQIGSDFRPVGSPGPCLLLDGPGIISFGRGQFGGPPLTAAATTTVRTCDPDASGTAVLASVHTGPGPAAWEPVACPASPTAPCPLEVDEFAYFLGETALTATPTEIDIDQVQSHTVQLPPPGSTGAGSRVRLLVDFMGIQR
jgi:hypothetical protein